jgi:hypothetical protein
VDFCGICGLWTFVGLNSNPAVSDQRASFSMSRTCILFNLGPERALPPSELTTMKCHN